MQPTLNARGGINKTSKREELGTVAGGSTGVTGSVNAQQTNIPINTLENPPTQLDLPQVEFDPSVATSAVQAAQGFADTQQAAAEKAAQAEATQTQGVRDLMSFVSGKGTERVQALEQAGVPELNKGLADLTTNIRLGTSRLAEFADQTLLGEEAMRQQAAGMDITKGTFSAMANERRLQRAIEQTGKAAALRTQIATAELMQNNITAATAQIDAALEAKYSPVEAALENEKFFLQRLWQVADKEDQRNYEAKSGVVQAQLDMIQSAKDMVKEALPYATPAELEMMNDPDLDATDQYKIASQVYSRGYQAANAPTADYREVGDQLVRINPDGTVEVAYGPQQAPSFGEIIAQGGSNIAALEATAGGDQVSQSFIETWSKSQTTLDQVEYLAKTFQEDEAMDKLLGGADVLAPITAIVRSNNPLDTKAKEINSLLNTIVPNLARGIYGEVGVLTDADFDRYAKTLPNLGSTEAVRQAVLGITIKAIKNSMMNRIENEAKAGNDVSGFASDVEQLEQKIGKLLLPANMRAAETKALIDSGVPKADIQKLYEAGYDPEEVVNYYRGGTTQSSGQPVSFNQAIDASANAIAAVESGGNYQAFGPVLNSGSYAGDRAYGKYQIMGRNIPSWSQQILGYSITPEQFVQSPELQDAIFKGMFAQHAKQYGSLQDAASVWFSGRPLAKAGNAQDQLGTSVPEYVKRFNQNLNLYA